MFPRVALISLACAYVAMADNVLISNNCSETIWPGIFPAANGGELGGFQLDAFSGQRSITLPSGYSGRIWGRTNCDDHGLCQTGTCPGGINCAQPAPKGPTLAQFTINGFGGNDFIAPSVDDGFNIAIAISTSDDCPIELTGCGDAQGDGRLCGQTSSCITGTTYTVTMCGETELPF